MRASPVNHYVFSDHAITWLARRELATDVVDAVMGSPEQRFEVRPGRDVLQSRVRVGDGLYLIRVFVDVDRWPPQVVTAYRTSRIAKYWRAS